MAKTVVRKKRLSAEGRAIIAEAQIARWKKYRAEKKAKANNVKKAKTKKAA